MIGLLMAALRAYALSAALAREQSWQAKMRLNRVWYGRAFSGGLRLKATDGSTEHLRVLSAALKRFWHGMAFCCPARFNKSWQCLSWNGVAMKRHREVPFAFQYLSNVGIH
jgi:hypothetical protein